MELVCGPLQPLSAVSLDVFARQGGAGGGRDTVPQLVERLRARLGEGAVYGIRSVAEHRPEAAWQRVQALRLNAVLPGAPAPDEPPGTGAVEPRPVWLLDEPTPLRVAEARQLAKSRCFSRKAPSVSRAVGGMGRGVARDYYIVRRAGGARLWVFQERQSKRWYVHGVFA